MVRGALCSLHFPIPHTEADYEHLLHDRRRQFPDEAQGQDERPDLCEHFQTV